MTTETVKLLFAGDFCPIHRITEIVERGDYSSILGLAKPYIEDADIAVVNLEAPVTHGGEKPIVKCGPALSCPLQSVDALKWVGFDLVTLANNHFLDYGLLGVENTISALDHHNIAHVGGGDNLEEAGKIYTKEAKGIRFAFINCCEHEFSIATESRPGAFPLDTVKLFYKIVEAQSIADFTVVVVHGGHEMYQLPSPRMVETYRCLVDFGADMVINNHQHCYSGYECYHDKYIFYGLGNFLFDEPKIKNSIWNEGYMVEATVDAEKNISVQLVPYTQCLSRVGVEPMDDSQRTDFQRKLDHLNEIISAPLQLKKNYAQYLQSSSEWLPIAFEPYGRGFRILRKKGLLPSIVSRERWLMLADYVLCEAHRDKLVNMFEQKIAVYNESVFNN